jgi:large subunit ribosomal protein L1
VENYAAALDEDQAQARRGQGPVPEEGHLHYHEGPGIPVDPNKTRNLSDDLADATA